jgi:prephenate dehydrogenase
MPRLAIIGLGLIGGSLGLAIKRAQPEGLEIAGFDREHGIGGRARKAGAIDIEARDPASAVEGAAIVVVATPISQVRTAFEAIEPALGEGTVVTDTASTKGEVIRWARECLPDGVSFVGGHPMAGKEMSGLGAAEPALFDGQAWAITPTANTPVRAIQTVESLVRLVGARAVVVDPHEHDTYVAAVSHLPLVAASAMFALLSGSQAWPDLAALAGPGLRDTTRLASTDPDLSHDISLTNRENIAHWLDRFIDELRRWRTLVADETRAEELAKALFEVQAKRNAFLESPPKHPEPESENQTLTSGEQMLSFMMGEYVVRRTKEMSELLEGKAEDGRESHR